MRIYNEEKNAWRSGKDISDGETLSSRNKRLFYIYGDIDSKNCTDIAFEINVINKEDDEKDSKEKNYVREPIEIYISSFGGSVYDMWLLIDTIMSSKTPVHTFCLGYAMSAAFQIFLAGHKRYAGEHATFMYHQIYCWRSGKYQDLVEDRDHMDFMNKQIEEFVTSRCDLSVEDLNLIREKKRDTYFSAYEAKKLKIVTCILGKEDMNDQI